MKPERLLIKQAGAELCQAQLSYIYLIALAMHGLAGNIVSLALWFSMGFKKKRLKKLSLGRFLDVKQWKTSWGSANVKLLKINSKSCGQKKLDQKMLVEKY